MVQAHVEGGVVCRDGGDGVEGGVERGGSREVR